jgi:hypothetical protein
LEVTFLIEPLKLTVNHHPKVDHALKDGLPACQDQVPPLRDSSKSSERDNQSQSQIYYYRSRVAIIEVCVFCLADGTVVLHI